MPSAVPKRKTKKRGPVAQGQPPPKRGVPFSLTQRAVSPALMVLALAYAFLAGLRTIWEFDLGFHLATARYILQHHVIPNSDILSYTALGAEWLYPPFAGVLFYGILRAWGYAGLSWFCALTLVATVACLLRRPSRPESFVAAALAIIAVPQLADRANPRPDLFTHLFFAIFLGLLWSFHVSDFGVAEGGETAAFRRKHMQLWILPALMLLWVNLHPGFFAGLGILAAYLLIEGLDLLFPERRSAARKRLLLAWPFLSATVLATLFNPFGLRIFKASLLIAGPQSTNMPRSGVLEWDAVPLSFHVLHQVLDWRNPASSYWWLTLASLAVISLALLRRQFGAALLTAAALYESMQHQRFMAMFSITVVVIGGTVLTQAYSHKKQNQTKGSARRRGLMSLLPALAACSLCLITCVRVADLISNRDYVLAGSTQQFGPGESWWFPERAADFIQREHLPGNFFQDYDLGGFTAWRLGPDYLDYIDGRFDHLAPAVYTEERLLLSSPPDAPVWKTVADRRGINILLFSLARIYGVQPPYLMSLCNSREWRPIYMDDVSIVLLRNSSENRRWIDRNQVDCQTHEFAPPPHPSRIELANFYANVGYILMQLGLHTEAVEDLNRGEELAPEDPSIHFALAGFYESRQQLEDAEREYKATLSVKSDNPTTLYQAGRFYASHGRYAEARPLILAAIQLSPMPASDYNLLGFLDQNERHPEQALVDFAKAEDAASDFYRGRDDLDPALYTEIAAGRAASYAQMKEWQRAIDFQQEATRRLPEDPSQWNTLGDLYDRAGQRQLADQARQRASALTK
jgi:tetratricopeptide (TPR) repeat protein